MTHSTRTRFTRRRNAISPRIQRGFLVCRDARSPIKRSSSIDEQSLKSFQIEWDMRACIIHHIASLIYLEAHQRFLVTFDRKK